MSVFDWIQCGCTAGKLTIKCILKTICVELMQNGGSLKTDQELHIQIEMQKWHNINGMTRNGMMMNSNKYLTNGSIFAVRGFATWSKMGNGERKRSYRFIHRQSTPNFVLQFCITWVVFFLEIKFTKSLFRSSKCLILNFWNRSSSSQFSSKYFLVSSQAFFLDAFSDISDSCVLFCVDSNFYFGKNLWVFCLLVWLTFSTEYYMIHAIYIR